MLEKLFTRRFNIFKISGQTNMTWLFIIIKVLIGVIVFGAIYQFFATIRDRRKFLPPGKLIKIANHNWHYKIMGEGSPTVIVDSGAGATHLDWQFVQPEVAKFTRIFTYDRAGYGWSDLSSKPRTAEQVISELRQLLREAEIEPPYVLVGMSLAGLYSRLFAYYYPEEVAGMVLVDVAHERMYEDLPMEWVKLNQRLDWLSVYVLPIMARIGLFRLLVTLDRFPFLPGLFQKMPTAVQPFAKAVYSQTQFGRAFAQESSGLSGSMKQVEQARSTKPFPKIPLIALSAGKPDVAGTPEMLQKLQKLHAELANDSPQGVHIISPSSGHVMQLDDPKLIIDSIWNVVEKVRSSR
ncbi:MAG: alpha/beta hydrolase [Nodularia sp. (in: Bacteria)]|nr:MAG: alpha/beta hydrolase [Nodularia sp. (in: cyanobacteria)]